MNDPTARPRGFRCRPVPEAETTADALRRIADQDIGGNAPWLADELKEVARKLELEWSGVYTGPADVQISVMSGQEAGLQRLRQQARTEGEAATEYAQLDKNGVFLVWDSSPEGEVRFPLVERIKVARSYGGRIFRRRVIVAENWEEVAEQPG